SLGLALGLEVADALQALAGYAAVKLPHLAFGANFVVVEAGEADAMKVPKPGPGFVGNGLHQVGVVLLYGAAEFLGLPHSIQDTLKDVLRDCGKSGHGRLLQLAPPPRTAFRRRDGGLVCRSPHPTTNEPPILTTNGGAERK